MNRSPQLAALAQERHALACCDTCVHGTVCRYVFITDLVLLHQLTRNQRTAAATIPAFENFVEEFGISITQASYTVSVQIIFLGVMPLLWVSPVLALSLELS